MRLDKQFCLIFISLFLAYESSVITNDDCTSVMCKYPTICQAGNCSCREGYTKESCTNSSETCYCPDGEDCSSGNCTCPSGTPFQCKMLQVCSANITITCKYNGTCVVKNTLPYCICPPTIHYTTECTPNRCDDSPCGRGTCIPHGTDDYSCVCPRGGVGKDCDVEKKCTDSFCTDNGVCYENWYAMCKCSARYTGSRCEENMTSNKCDALGTRTEVNNTSTNDTLCVCQEKFKGKTCNFNDCEKNNPCINGLCYPDPVNYFACVCSPGWTGALCEKDIDECVQNPCGSNGTCTNEKGSYVCHCPDNTTGQYCKSEQNTCTHYEVCMKVAKDGICNADCNHVTCNFDGGDCLLETDPWENCMESVGFCRYVSGNKMCNTGCNNEGCLYDLLDCDSMAEVCPENCLKVWGDGNCQNQCNIRSCGFDGSDCEEINEEKIIGTLLVTFISESEGVDRTLGRIISSYTGTTVTLHGTTAGVQTIRPFELNVKQNQSSQHTSFYTVSNFKNCPTNDTQCWTDTNSVASFTAALYTKSGSIFHHETMPIILKHIQGCMIGYYGQMCDQSCGHCNNSKGCNLTNGHCSDGCIKGYFGETCDKECSQNCLIGCESVDGNCTNEACMAGYLGASCSERCPIGKYGMSCMYNCSENCNMNKCNNINGSCSCIGGFKGEMCDTECENGTFGADCQQNCGHCLNNATCNKVDGSCPKGCEAGYTGRLCDFMCVKGKYGIGCTSSCTNCANNDCYTDSGTCKTGCKSGWSGDTCMKAVSSEKKGADNSTITAVIIVMVVLILIGLALAFVLWKRNKNGAYLFGEKKSEGTPMKEVNGGEIANNTHGEVEPLIAATPKDKNFPDAKLVIESEGIDLDKEEQPHKESERSSKASDFRPESIHGNGPGGVYVGNGKPVDGGTGNTTPIDMSEHSDGSDNDKKSSSSADSDEKEKDKAQNEENNAKDTKSNESKDTQEIKSSDENVEQDKNESSGEKPETKVDDSGLISTENL